MAKEPTRMRCEIDEIPDAVDRLLTDGTAGIAAAADAVRDLDPPLISTVARGSSDHVCTFFKYACEVMCGVPVASLGPSIASIYKAPLRLPGAVCIGVSQSGKSPDIVEMSLAAARGGAMSIALTNHIDSPLAQNARFSLPIHAGPELSVAATKTFVTSAVASLMLLAHWRMDKDLLGALTKLPPFLEKAAGIDWPQVRAALTDQSSLFTLGRGQTLAMSNEAALKFKETCQLHAESYSSAEVMHGPVSIVDRAFPVLAFAVRDEAETALAETADILEEKGANVFVTSPMAKRAHRIDHIDTGHGLTDAIALIVSFYAMVEAVAVSRGIDPDTPRHLNKVTETV